jgi:uncharacterized protein (TIGR03435 family)
LIVRAFANFAVLAVLGAPVFAQAPPPAQSAAAQPNSDAAVPSTTPATAAQAKFEAADVGFIAPSRGIFFSGPFLRSDRYILHQATMTQLVATAYNFRVAFVGGGPSWIHWDRYDIMAKVPPGTTLDAARIMQQNLLAERFKLVVHRGDVPVPAYLLTVANGKLNLKPSASAEEGSCKPHWPSYQASGPPQPTVVECRGVTMDSLVKFLIDIGGAGYVGNATPVINDAELKGAYDFDFTFTPQYFLAQAGIEGVSLFQALEQVGLKLTLKTTPQPGIIIDSVNREPTPNASDLANVMPPLPAPQFEVATIRPTDPNNKNGMGRFNPNDLSLQGMTLRALITMAWDLNFRDDGSLVAPKWLDSDRIDIRAKVADSDLGTNRSGKSGTMNFDDLRPMLRSLLIDRFQIKYHMEDRPIDSYALVAADPKLTKADPTAKTGCGPALVDHGNDPRTTNVMLDSNQTCVNVTMEQFASQVHHIAADYFFYPVKDETGLKGAFDFTIFWSSARLTQGPGPSAGPAPAAMPDAAQTASEPNGAISFFDAIRKQLGLKIVKEKRPEPVLVIDQIDEKPTEN